MPSTSAPTPVLPSVTSECSPPAAPNIIPEALPPEYIIELTKLQSQAPPMGWAFVKRRMQAELGADWQQEFASFEHHPAAAASLGQVHRARSLDGEELACKLQYADMQS